MINVRRHRDHELTKTQIYNIISLENSIWPNREKTVQELTERFLERLKNKTNREHKESKSMRFVVWDGDKSIAHANIFTRTIYAAKGEIEVMALAGVCVSLERRGEGLGKNVVECAFDQIDKGKFSVALYQTGIPVFYEKFGATIIANEFCNHRNPDNPAANPWWEPYVMIYPSSFQWPVGKIDLNGPGY